MSFITEKRLFGKQLKPTTFSAYFLDFLSLFAIWLAIVYSLPELHRFIAREDQVIAPPSAIAGIGFVFTYGIRISMYVAMIRRNRAPQVIEWCCMLIGLVVPLICWLFDGLLLHAFASASGYSFCRSVATDPLVKDLFVLRGHSCPPG